eukprot:m.50388 g.50388  ORF g.50388 m.50388 type:complete len:80 (+) comp7234_c0_seq2:397-636(+)
MGGWLAECVWTMTAPMQTTATSSEEGVPAAVPLNSLNVPGGAESPVIFMHGLYGASGNFRSAMKQLSQLTNEVHCTIGQ